MFKFKLIPIFLFLCVFIFYNTKYSFCADQGDICENTYCHETNFSLMSAIFLSYQVSDLCSKKTYCYQMDSCDEAIFFYEVCDFSYLDSDNDGIPCERLCRDDSKYEHQEKSEMCQILSIVDGDTLKTKFDSQTHTLRLVGIDTPEKTFSEKLINDAKLCGVSPEDIKILGYLSSLYLRKLLEGDSAAICILYGVGYYGRDLARLEISGLDINKTLVKEGFACIYRSSEVSVSYLQDLEALMIEASLERKGLWRVNYDLMSCLCGLTNNVNIKYSSPVIIDKRTFFYEVSDFPVLSVFPEKIQPFGIFHEKETGKIHLIVSLPAFAYPINVYLGIQIPTGIIFILDGSNTWIPFKNHLFAWREYVEDSFLVDFGVVDLKNLPKGLYKLLLLVTPYNNFDNYYLWVGNFMIY